MSMQSRNRRFRSFRVKYSPKYVDTSVGHVCMFGDKKYSVQTALLGASGPVSFAELYGQVCHLAYLLRHIGVAPGLRAYLDCDAEHSALVGLLGGLRGGLSIVVNTQGSSIEARNAAIAEHGCTIVLTSRPESLVGSDKVVIVLDRLPQLALPKELDWALPRPLPEDIALRVCTGTAGDWREFSHGELAAMLRDQNEPFGAELPFQSALARLAQNKPLVQPSATFPTRAISSAVECPQQELTP